MLSRNHRRFSEQRLWLKRRKGAWTRAEQRRFRSPSRRLLIRDAWVRPQIAPGCLVFSRPPGSKVRSRRVPLSSLLSSLGPESLSGGGMEEKVESTTTPDGPCVVSVQETEKWMEEAMRMVRNRAGGC